MKKHLCTVCQYQYDEAIGDPENGVEAGTKFEDLPQGWICPVCGESVMAFEEVEAVAN